MAKRQVENKRWPEDHETNIKPVEIVDEVRSSMLQYAMSVLVSRAIPDVRDGLKPVHRRILYTMYQNGLTPDKAYRKCADTVGTVLGRYHPHGDASVYDAMVRMAQPFSLRYPLIDGHGNFGNIDGYPAAAYRYTESRMNRLSLHMLDDIEKETVDFMPNYDDRLQEPVVLPVRFPQLLVNGSSGIAVGMATEIPPHNLGEVIDGMCCLIDNPDAELSEICQYIKGPDFPTGGIIMGHAGIRSAYATGRGKITVRGRAEIEETKPGKFRIVITEIPYKVRKKDLVKHIYDLAADKKIEGIDDVVDYSSERDGGMRIVVDIKKDANPQVVLNKLYTYTELQTTFGAILIALADGKPKTLTLKEMLQNCIDFQCDIIRRRTEFDRRKAAERAHILEGLKVALDFIDEVISIIRNSKTIPESKEKLTARFGLDDIQTTAIVQMQLGKLAGLEKQKILEELDEKLAFIAKCDEILADHSKILDIVKTESLNLRDRFSDDRRTEITDVLGEVDVEDLIPEEECVFTKTQFGYIKRIPAEEYRIQRKGGRGKIGLTTREEDTVDTMFTCSSHDYIMFFTTKGKAYKIKGYEIPMGSRTSKGLNIVNILPLESDEKVSSMLMLPEGSDEKFICMVTKYGVVKRTQVVDFKNIRKTGIIAINLDENDVLENVKLTSGNDDIFVATRYGLGIRFNENDARVIGRTARGVKAISFKSENDFVVGMEIINENDGGKVLTVSELGFGRKSDYSDYLPQTRGGFGSMNYRVDKYGLVAGIKIVYGDDDVILISSNGIIIRISADEIRECARPSKGVRLMKLGDEDKLITFTTTKKSEDDENSDDTVSPLPETEETDDDIENNNSETED